jgi:hypothetical protein
MSNNEMYESSKALQGGLGATVWAVLEGVRRGQASEQEVKLIEDLCNKYFPKITNDECNSICQVLERRLKEDQEAPGRWYSDN